MTEWLSILLNFLVSLVRTRRDLALENLLLRQQLAVLKESGARPQLSQTDRSFWVFMSRIWPRWRDVLHIVRPETVIRWHREGFRRHWTAKCRKRGRPPIDPQIRALIRRMCEANPLWGAPRIHGELLKLGIYVVKSQQKRDTFSSFLKAIPRGEQHDKIRTSEARGLAAEDTATRGE